MTRECERCHGKGCDKCGSYGYYEIDTGYYEDAPQEGATAVTQAYE